MKRQAGKHRRDVQLSIGDWVYLKDAPYKWKSLAHIGNEKLSPRYYGSYQVIEQTGDSGLQASIAKRM